MYPIESEDFVLNGLAFRAEIFSDEDMCEPWKESDGHGIVSEWTTRDKRPGEKVLSRDGSYARYYDVAATLPIALRDGWDAPPYQTGTKREQAARAVESDYQHLRAWCRGDWYWTYLKVTLLDADGELTNETESCGGFESDDTDYLKSESRNMAETICARFPDETAAGDIPLALTHV